MFYVLYNIIACVCIGFELFTSNYNELLINIVYSQIYISYLFSYKYIFRSTSIHINP